MNSYSRKFFDPNNPDNVITITWEGAYRNVKAYHKGVVVAETDGVASLQRGTLYEAGALGVIQLGLTTEKPIVPTVHVNNERFYAAGERTEAQQALRTVSLAYWILFGLGVVGFLISYNLVSAILDFPEIMTMLVIDAVLVLIYAVSALLCRWGLRAGYYIGTGLFLLVTVYMLIGGGILQYQGIAFIVMLLFRGLIIYFLLSQFARIHDANSRAKRRKSDFLLDD
jgi:hypothetical protein